MPLPAWSDPALISRPSMSSMTHAILPLHVPCLGHQLYSARKLPTPRALLLLLLYLHLHHERRASFCVSTKRSSFVPEGLNINTRHCSTVSFIVMRPPHRIKRAHVCAAHALAQRSGFSWSGLHAIADTILQHATSPLPRFMMKFAI